MFFISKHAGTYCTLRIPRICIFAIISAVNRSVTVASQQNVIYCKCGNFINVFVVLQLTDAKLIKAHSLISLLTHL